METTIFLITRRLAMTTGNTSTWCNGRAARMFLPGDFDPGITKIHQKCELTETVLHPCSWSMERDELGGGTIYIFPAIAHHGHPHSEQQLFSWAGNWEILMSIQFILFMQPYETLSVYIMKICLQFASIGKVLIHKCLKKPGTNIGLNFYYMGLYTL